MWNFLIQCFWVVITSLPYYSFYIFMYRYLKRHSPEGNISKRTYEQIKDPKPNRAIQILDSLDIIFKKTVVLLFVIIFSSSLALIIINFTAATIREYMISANALRLQKYLIEHYLALMITLIGSIAVFSSIGKKHYIFFSPKDIIHVLKIKENLISLLIYYAFCLLSVFIYYFCHYIVISSEISNTIKMLCFIITLCFSTIVLVNLVKLFLAIIVFLLSNHTEKKILNSLYKKIHSKNTLSINTNDEQEIDNSLDYLLENLDNSKNIEFSFVSSIDNYHTFSKRIKFKIFASTAFFGTIFNLMFILLIMAVGVSIKATLGTVICASITLNFVGCLIFKFLPSYKIAVQGVMGAWGMMVTDANHKEFCLTCCDSKRNKIYSSYFNKIYNVIYLFKSILDTKTETSEEYLKKIQKNGDYILYSVCMFLYNKKHPRKKNILKDYCTYIKKEKVNMDILKGNLKAIISDIERYDCENDVDKFINTAIVCLKEKKS